MKHCSIICCVSVRAGWNLNNLLSSGLLAQGVLSFDWVVILPTISFYHRKFHGDSVVMSERQAISKSLKSSGIHSFNLSLVPACPESNFRSWNPIEKQSWRTLQRKKFWMQFFNKIGILLHPTYPVTGDRCCQYDAFYFVIVSVILLTLKNNRGSWTQSTKLNLL